MDREIEGNSAAAETGLIDGGLDRAAQSFASLLAAEDGNPDERESPEESSSPGAERPTGSEEATEADSDVDVPHAGPDAEAEPEGASEGDPEGAPEGEETEEPRYAVKVDGKTEEVPLSELLSGYSRFEDYHRKTTKLAEERRAFEAEAQAVRAERETYATLLSQLEQQLSQAGEPDWDKLYQEDPIEYVRQRQLHEERERKREAARAEQARLTEAKQREQHERLQALLVEEKQKLLAALPKWADPEVARQEREAIKGYAMRALGFSAEELDAIVDHRAVLTLHKAMAYDRLQASRAQLKQKRAPAPERTVKPGSAGAVSPPPDQAARQRLRKTGSVRDAAAVFETLLE